MKMSRDSRDDGQTGPRTNDSKMSRQDEGVLLLISPGGIDGLNTNIFFLNRGYHI